MKSLKCLIMLSALFFVAFLPNIQADPMTPLVGNEWVIDNFDSASYIGIGGATYSNSYAGYTSALWSGYYLGTFAGNDDPGDVLALARIYLDDDDFTFDVAFKVDEPAETDGSLTIDYDSEKSGTWSLSKPYEIGFYTVKASNHFALFYVDPFQSSGIWSTTNILNNGGNIPAISHFSAFPTEGGFGGGEIPEPSTLLLIGTGILGLGIFGRKRLQK